MFTIRNKSSSWLIAVERNKAEIQAFLRFSAHGTRFAIEYIRRFFPTFRRVYSHEFSLRAPLDRLGNSVGRSARTILPPASTFRSSRRSDRSTFTRLPCFRRAAIAITAARFKPAVVPIISMWWKSGASRWCLMSNGDFRTDRTVPLTINGDLRSPVRRSGRISAGRGTGTPAFPQDRAAGTTRLTINLADRPNRPTAIGPPTIATIGRITIARIVNRGLCRERNSIPRSPRESYCR
jgi:hypothetical protein